MSVLLTCGEGLTDVQSEALATFGTIVCGMFLIFNPISLDYIKGIIREWKSK